MIDKEGRWFNLSCDVCGDTYVTFCDNFYDAVNYKKQNGWKSQKYRGEWEDVCPECQEEDK